MRARTIRLLKLVEYLSKWLCSPLQSRVTATTTSDRIETGMKREPRQRLVKLDLSKYQS
jgi:hypothetical protein